MKVKYIVYLLLIIGIGGLIGYRIYKNNEQNTGPLKSGNASSIKVGGMVLKPQEFKDNLSLSGSLEANEQIEIRSEVSGVVESINFEEGSKVSEGQILVKVNDIELRAQLSKAKTAQKLAAENERRAKLLLEKQAISQEEYDVASADLQSAQAESDLIAAQLSKTSIRAPFSGTIGLRSISKGSYVTPVTIIAKLVNTKRLKLTFSIPEKYASRMQLNSTFTFTTTNNTEEHTAKIYAIEPEVEVATRTLKMRAITDNSEQKLYPGMYVNVNLPLETVTNALMVPTEALIPIQNGKKIFIARNGRAQEIEVQTGARTDRYVRVLSGLKPGDTILTYGVMALDNGTPVKLDLINPDASTENP
ncbi:efflux RND transporter periplasmic adaptor subunit [Galbibacter pacificus]|uniref:Efflux RND transporter periplasmic adaptor subunit n=1 Tax=Galbibacter pacificus TaxID=2996052 RepID=A0ABT6FUR4_9FLAO|nr:efflux RND transporter periplasmic adaptor subunit [Galbibacter pacificus]MDG3583511.1 efflux RND transporter periplasmic adaptor subunit [Galbibacter pacificus]MDG3587013.1 efflux RND transporter periplasmic adaptor subunit [Galbibacter pacificus]